MTPIREADVTPEERYAGFEVWLFAMSETLAAWRAGLPEALRARLDGSIGSLDALEEWLLERVPDARSAVAGEHFLVVDGAARYVGETFRQNLGARWDMDVHDPRGLVFGVPSMRGFPRPGIPVVPLRLVVNVLERRQPGTFKFILENLV